MTEKTKSIEVDSATASALKTRAAERGVSVSQLVAELVPFAIDDEAIAELDRRWARSRLAARPCRMPKSSVAAHLGNAGVPALV